MTDVIGLLGMPGAGKTTAYKHLKNQENFTGFQMKEVAGNEFQKMQENGLEVFPSKVVQDLREKGLVTEATPEGPIGEEIADWVDTVLSVSPAFFAKRAVRRIEKTEEDATVIIDGLRSTADAKHVSSAVDDLTLIYLHTPFCTRLSRIMDRSRSGEEDADAHYLVDRDQQELSWGVDEILKEQRTDRSNYSVEYFYANYDSVEPFLDNITQFVQRLD